MQILTSDFSHYHEAYSCFHSKKMNVIDKWIEQDFDTFFVDKLCQNIDDHSELHVLGVGSGNGLCKLYYHDSAPFVFKGGVDVFEGKIVTLPTK